MWKKIKTFFTCRKKESPEARALRLTYVKDLTAVMKHVNDQLQIAAAKNAEAHQETHNILQDLKRVVSQMNHSALQRASVVECMYEEEEVA